MRLLDLQERVAAAVMTRDGSLLTPMLVDGENAHHRLDVHGRHYEASLTRVLVDRFPATAWLTGLSFVEGAARNYIRRHPPSRPCLAEYGEHFPAFLGTQPQAADLPYVQDFAELEWRVGEVAVNVDGDAASIAELARLTPEEAEGTVLALQPGVRYVEAAWAVDTLMTAYLTDSAPGRFVIAHEQVCLEVRGARGDVRFPRLPFGDFCFRRALASGTSLGAAVEQAALASDSFDPAPGLAALFASSLVRSVR
jgi:hypothetical protein